MEEEVHGMIDSVMKMQQETIRNTVNIKIGFKLNGHTIEVSGMNPDILFRVVQEMKNNKHRLTNKPARMELKP